MKKLALVLLAVILLAGIVFVALGFTPRTDVFLGEYTVSPDGTQIDFYVSVASSMGYTRGFREKMGGFNLYLTFYSAFGGFNSAVGARNTFRLEVDPVNCDEIYFNRGNGGYELILQKNPQTGRWERP